MSTGTDATLEMHVDDVVLSQKLELRGVDE